MSQRPLTDSCIQHLKGSHYYHIYFTFYSKQNDTSWRQVLIVCVPRCEPSGGHWEWFEAARPQWSGQSLPPHQLPQVPADGCPRGSQPAHHHIRSLVPLMASLLSLQSAKAASAFGKRLLSLMGCQTLDAKLYSCLLYSSFLSHPDLKLQIIRLLRQVKNESYQYYSVLCYYRRWLTLYIQQYLEKKIGCNVNNRKNQGLQGCVSNLKIVFKTK